MNVEVMIEMGGEPCQVGGQVMGWARWIGVVEGMCGLFYK
jgi:hypothetical protein